MAACERLSAETAAAGRSSSTAAAWRAATRCSSPPGRDDAVGDEVRVTIASVHALARSPRTQRTPLRCFFRRSRARRITRSPPAREVGRPRNEAQSGAVNGSAGIRPTVTGMRLQPLKGKVPTACHRSCAGAGRAARPETMRAVGSAGDRGALNDDEIPTATGGAGSSHVSRGCSPTPLTSQRCSRKTLTASGHACSTARTTRSLTTSCGRARRRFERREQAQGRSGRRRRPPSRPRRPSVLVRERDAPQEGEGRSRACALRLRRQDRGPAFMLAAVDPA